MSGFLRGYLRDAPIETTCGYANAGGAFAVSRLLCSAEYATWPELQHFLAEGAATRALGTTGRWRTCIGPRRATRDARAPAHVHPASIMAFAIDHRSRLEAMADEAGAPRQRICDLKLLAVEAAEIDGTRLSLFAGIWAIFGHGNVAGLGEALEGTRETLPTFRAHNEQAMAHSAVAFAKASRRRRMMACTTSVGPGATNMVTAAAVAHVNRLPVLMLPSDVCSSRRPDPVLQQVEDFGDGAVSANDRFRPVSRYFDRITRPEQIIPALERALAVLTDPAECGPVTLAFCQDVQAEAYDYLEHFFAERLRRIRRPAPDPVGLDDAVRLLAGARKPLIVAGGGVLFSGAEAKAAVGHGQTKTHAHANRSFSTSTLAPGDRLILQKPMTPLAPFRECSDITSRQSQITTCDVSIWSSPMFSLLEVYDRYGHSSSTTLHRAARTRLSERSPEPRASRFAKTLHPAPDRPAGSGERAPRKIGPYGPPHTTAIPGVVSAAERQAVGAGSQFKAPGFTGAGLKIGIVSDSFNARGGAAADEADGALPGARHVHVLKEDSSGTDEGRAMAQIIHSIAPQAQIYFYSGINGESDMAAGIDALKAKGAKIIVDDISYPGESFYHRGDPVDSAIDRFIGSGGSYFTAAGNAGPSSASEGVWRQMQASLPGVGRVNTENFGSNAAPRAYESLHLTAGLATRIDLQWAEPYARNPRTSASFSLGYAIYGPGGQLVALGNQNQTGHMPVQFAEFKPKLTGQYKVAIFWNGGARAYGTFKILGDNDARDPASFGKIDDGSGSIFGHALNPYAITVGASDYHDSPGFSRQIRNEKFSSVGPGKLAEYLGGRLRWVDDNKPGLTGPDGFPTSMRGLSSFFGTSAAAPAVAAIAALVLQADPTLTPLQVKLILERTAARFGDRNQAGTGLVQAKAAVALAERQEQYDRWHRAA